MTTFSSAALEQKAITNFFDYGTKVPNLAFAMTGDGVGTARTPETAEAPLLTQPCTCGVSSPSRLKLTSNES